MGLALHYSKDVIQGRQLAKLAEFVRAVEKPQVKASKPLPKIHKLEQRLPPEVGEQVAAAYQAGASTTDLRRQFGLSQSSILKLLAEHGVASRHQGLTEDEALTVVALYQEGQTIMQLAEKFSVAFKTVRRALVEQGVVIRPRFNQEPGQGRQCES